MTVYVCTVRGAEGQFLACLMSADTPGELYGAVFRLGIARRRGRNDQINITDGQRIAAIADGAVEVSVDCFGKMDFCRRKTRKPCTPDEAQAFYAGWMAERSVQQAARARKTRRMREALDV